MQPLRFLVISLLATSGVAHAQFLADLKPTYLRVPSPILPRGTGSIRSTIKNVGIWPSSATRSAYYFSTNSTISTGDRLLVSFPTKGLGIGGSQTVDRTVTFPVDIPRGSCYLGVYANYNSAISEVTKGNNGLGVKVSCLGEPDLYARSFTLTPANQWARGQSVVASASVGNAGGVSASQTTGFYLSSDSVITSSDRLLATWAVGLGARGVASKAIKFTIPKDAALGHCYLGMFVDYLHQVSESSETNNTIARGGTCYLLGTFTPYGKGCLGSNGVPSHVASNPKGYPYIGTTSTYTLNSGPKNWLAVMFLGFSQTQWGAVPLPFALDSVGAKGCQLLAPPTFEFGAGTNASGTASVPIPHPNDVRLIGLDFYTQFAGFDRAANPLGLSFSNGLRTILGSPR